MSNPNKQQPAPTPSAEEPTTAAPTTMAPTTAPSAPQKLPPQPSNWQDCVRGEEYALPGGNTIIHS